MTILARSLSAVTLCSSLYAGAAHADDCASLMRGHLDYVRGRAYDRTVRVTMVSNQGNNTVGYAEGFLAFQAGAPDSLESDGYGTEHTFNDRRHFDRAAADRLGIKIDANGRVTLTAISWGGGTQSFNTQCQDGVMYGFAAGIGFGPPALHVISFNDEPIPG